MRARTRNARFSANAEAEVASPDMDILDESDDGFDAVWRNDPGLAQTQ